MKTSCLAKAEMVVLHRVCCKRVAVLVIKIQSFKVIYTYFRSLSARRLLLTGDTIVKLLNIVLSNYNGPWVVWGMLHFFC